MIHLFNKTEYSLGHAFGSIDAVLDAQQANCFMAGICDRGGTWGHWEWVEKCIKRGIKPVLGVELACVNNILSRDKQPIYYVSFLAKNNNGLKKINELVKIASQNFYYEPRLSVFSVLNFINHPDVVVAFNNIDLLKILNISQYTQLSNFIFKWQYFTTASHLMKNNIFYVSDCNNKIPKEKDALAWSVLTNNSIPCYPIHIINDKAEFLSYCREAPFADTFDYNQFSKIEMSVARFPTFSTQALDSETILRKTCESSSRWKNDYNYKRQFEKEMKVIESKKFSDYFLLVHDVVNWARQRMLVGPGRGSCCGSLICYYLHITTVDPIVFDLSFDRFINVTRNDMPDIDIDFPDEKRLDVIDYLTQKYQHVSKLGTVSRLKLKLALRDCVRSLRLPSHLIPKFDITMSDITPFFEEYPQLKIIKALENHTRHAGMHAAAVIVSKDDLLQYGSIDTHKDGNVLMLQKANAEALNLLKIDVLGLRTLTILEEALHLTDKPLNYLYKLPLDDVKTLSLFNTNFFAGIFQFEGEAVKNITQQITVKHFDDLAAITALSRPGPLQSGAAQEFVKRHKGEPFNLLMPAIKNITQSTLGLIIYQEQVMAILQQIGDLPLHQVHVARKAMSKSNIQMIESLYDIFKANCIKKNISTGIIDALWEQLKTMGAWAFNKSHAIAYSLITYYCAYLKTHYPMQFYVCLLRHAKNDDATKAILREMYKKDIQFKLIDKNSKIDWSLKNDIILGGLKNIIGVGEKSAQLLYRKITNQETLTVRQQKLLKEGITPFDNLFQLRDRWVSIYNDPEKFRIQSELATLEDVNFNQDSQYVIIVTIKEIKKCNHNEEARVRKRGGRLLSPPLNFWMLTLNDDYKSIKCMIDRFYVDKHKQLLEESLVKNIDIILKCTVNEGFKLLKLNRFKILTGNPNYEK